LRQIIVGTKGVVELPFSFEIKAQVIDQITRRGISGGAGLIFFQGFVEQTFFLQHLTQTAVEFIDCLLSLSHPLADV